jgi:alpha-galactosidase
MLARWAGVPYEQVVYRAAGINHLAWILELRAGDRDLYPLIRERIDDPAILGSEPVRIELFKHFGYFVTESSGHASEYNPYFRKTPEMAEALTERFTSPHDDWFKWGRTGGYLTHCRETLPTYLNEVADQAAGKANPLSERSSEYCSWIMDAMETNQPFTFNGNVMNRSLITNLPDGCCVEVPCLVNGSGIQPTVVGDLPPQLAALDRTMINVQSLAVHAGIHGDQDAVYHALMLDPLTAATMTLDQIRAMADDMIAAEQAWLPQLHSSPSGNGPKPRGHLLSPL